MSEMNRNPIGEKRNAPIWQVFGLVLVLMGLASGSFYYGAQNSSTGVGQQYDYGTDYGTGDDAGYGTGDDSGYDSSYDSSVTGGQIDIYILNNFIGYGSTSVERTLRSAGFFVSTRYTNGDPSLNARINDGCTVIDQSPVGGSEVYAGSTVTILADCPLTGEW
jgi:hypothetical protein